MYNICVFGAHSVLCMILLNSSSDTNYNMKHLHSFFTASFPQPREIRFSQRKNSALTIWMERLILFTELV